MIYQPFPNVVDRLTSYTTAFPKTKWLICGKGPTLDLDKIKRCKDAGYKLCSLNEAMLASGEEFDLVVSNDVLSLGKIHICTGQFEDLIMAIPTGLHSQHFSRVNNWTSLCEIVDIVHKHAKRIYTFDIHNLGCVQHFSTSYKINVYHSSVESAIQIIALSGVKHIEFTGVGTGSEYFKTFKHLNEPVDMTPQLACIAKLRNVFHDVYFAGLPQGMLLNSDETSVELGI